MLTSLLIFFLFCESILNTKTSKNNVKMIRKTASHSYPKDWWPFTPTTIQDYSSVTVTRTIPMDKSILSLSYTIHVNNNINTYNIKPTKFVDFKKSKAYKNLWKRTHRGLHWLPPKVT